MQVWSEAKSGCEDRDCGLNIVWAVDGISFRRTVPSRTTVHSHLTYKHTFRQQFEDLSSKTLASPRHRHDKTLEYQPKGGDALRLGSKGSYGSCVGGK